MVRCTPGSPAYLENWWYALWAYSTGWHNQGSDASGQYGLGWTTNMANEDLQRDRPAISTPAMTTPSTPARGRTRSE
jgi:hypothetical protein